MFHAKADQPIWFRKQSVQVFPTENNTFSIYNVVSAEEFVKHPDPTTSVWTQLMLAFASGAEYVPSPEKLDRFQQNQIVALFASDENFKKITSSPEKWQHLCVLGGDYPATRNAEFAIDVMSVYVNGLRLMRILPTNPELHQTVENGTLLSTSVKINTCEPLVGKLLDASAPDASGVLSN